MLNGAGQRDHQNGMSGDLVSQDRLGSPPEVRVDGALDVEDLADCPFDGLSVVQLPRRAAGDHWPCQGRGEQHQPAFRIRLRFRVPAGYSSLAFHQHILEEAHVSITPGHIYGENGEGWARISLVAPTAQLREALSRLKVVAL